MKPCKDSAEFADRFVSMGLSPGDVHRFLSPYLTQERLQRIDDVLSRRTDRVCVVLDNLYHEHNMSAVVRTMDAFGFQELHVIENITPFRPHKGIALGTQQWITIVHHNSFEACISHLEGEGRVILAADPPDKAQPMGGSSRPAYPLTEIPVEPGQPLALVFGRELEGLHQELRDMTHGTFYIPLHGFVESLNVSVTVAVSLHEMRRKIDELPEESWRINHEKEIFLRDLWCLNSVNRGWQVLQEVVSRKEGSGKLS